MPQIPNHEVTIAERIFTAGHALTANELADILNVSRAFLYRLAADGKLPSFRLGSAIRFDPAAVAAWLRKERRG